jgi:hypothetical protein
MRKVIITSVIALIISFVAMAEDRKVAVFDPAGNADVTRKYFVY